MNQGGRSRGSYRLGCGLCYLSYIADGGKADARKRRRSLPHCAVCLASAIAAEPRRTQSGRPPRSLAVRVECWIPGCCERTCGEFAGSPRGGGVVFFDLSCGFHFLLRSLLFFGAVHQEGPLVDCAPPMQRCSLVGVDCLSALTSAFFVAGRGGRL